MGWLDSLKMGSLMKVIASQLPKGTKLKTYKNALVNGEKWDHCFAWSQEGNTTKKINLQAMGELVKSLMEGYEFEAIQNVIIEGTEYNIVFLFREIKNAS